MIRAVELQGVVQRNQDVASANQNEHQRAVIQQGNAMVETKKEAESIVKQVHQKEDMENRGKNSDAKEKGNNEYEGDGGRKRKKQDKDGSVRIKERQGFDMKA